MQYIPTKIVYQQIERIEFIKTRLDMHANILDTNLIRIIDDIQKNIVSTINEQEIDHVNLDLHILCNKINLQLALYYVVALDIAVTIIYEEFLKADSEIIQKNKKIIRQDSLTLYNLIFDRVAENEL